WTTFGTTEIAQVLEPGRLARIAAANPALMTTICLCLFTGAIGKSAQFPLHVWLPDAMEGPTPVSALIHAATMVTAGVYLVARCTPLFQAAPDAQVFVALIGGITALLAALIALTQHDLKRVLAYSTVSQLGFMFLGLGTGTLVGIGGAMFHLVTHAFFKALLFLGAGSVMHAMGGVIDMREFRGLKSLMPQTHTTFLIGALALAGLPPLSGFWSKDTILGAVYEQAYPHESEVTTETAGETHAAPVTPFLPPQETMFGVPRARLFTLLYWLGTLTAGLTAFYTFRAFFLTFYGGPERVPHAAGHHAHESPAVMCIPLWILSAGAALLGLVLGHLTGVFDGFLDQTLPG
ncbi:MAG: proton-conducting transporter membrane subunit, partial [Planctomycetaceae bacterium]